MNHERRRSPRYQLIAEAEIIELRSRVRLNAKTSDVSLLGCFMNAERSLPTGTTIQVELKRHDMTFTSLGVIARAQPMGMGVSFSNIKPDQREVLQKWLIEISRGVVN